MPEQTIGTRARARAQTIEDLKRVARAHLATDGADLSLRSVARELGMVSSAVYRYFDTKEALVNALYRHWKSVYNAMVLAPLPPGLMTRDKFTTYWQRMTDL